MEILLGILVFGLLGAITVYGYSHSNRAARSSRNGIDGRSDKAAMVSGDSSSGNPGN